MSDTEALKLTIETLFNEISEDLAETINGGLSGICHGQLVA